MIIHITEKEKDWRLDKFLVLKFPRLSRAFIQKTIINGQVLVNDKKISKHRFLKINDKITINFDPQEVQQKKQINLEPNKAIKLAIVFEDANYLVVDKPANLIIHPSEIHPEADTLINGLLAYLPEINNIGEDKTRPGIVHRLDKEVSGLMVIAKTQEAYLDLKKQFQQRKIYKEYLALVHGIPAHKQYTIDFNIERSKTDGRKMAAKPDSSGKAASTEYEVVKEFSNYALLKVIIHTGRTHQIRVHLNALGYPIVGDTIYYPKSLRTNIKLNRIFLHSHILKFKNLAGVILSYQRDLPKELKDLLAGLS